MRHELRAILARRQLSVERALGVLSAALRPVPVPVEVPLGADRGRLRQLAERIEPASEPVLSLLTLARALRMAGEDALAEQVLRKALTARPREVVLYHALGQQLTGQKPPRWAEAVQFYRAARGLRPELGVNLAEALRRSGHAGEALDLLALLVKERPDNPYLHFIQAYTLSSLGDVDGAIACYRKAIELDPKNAYAHNNLGVALRARGDRDGAIACYRKAINLDSKYSPAHNNLGLALYDKHDLDGAIACYHKAIELDPKNAKAHYNLGNALRAKGNLEGAIPSYLKAIELDAKYLQARLALGQALLQQGHYAEARQSMNAALQLLSPSHPLYQRTATQLRNCEALLAADRKLPAVLRGEASPANADEAITLAQMCQRHKKRYLAAARLYAEAFAAKPKLMGDVKAQHRYKAACSAALAAAGQGEDVRQLPDKVVVMYRRWALGWLRDDLMLYSELAQHSNPHAKQAIQQLMHWRCDPALAGLRDKGAIAKLPKTERDACQKLWTDVAALLQRVQEK